jgi:phosphate transport system substrate-binding protein
MKKLFKLLIIRYSLYSIICSLFFAFAACNNNSTLSIGQNNKDTLKGSISISGAFALYPMTLKWAEEFKKIHPQVSIYLSGGGAGKGMDDALSGKVDLGMISRIVSPDEEAKGVWIIPVVKDAVVAVINSKNPVLKDIKDKGLTRDKLIDIFVTGKINRWGDCVGTADKSKLNVYIRSDACGAAEMWAKYLGTMQDGLKGTGVFGDPGVAYAVKNDPLGIGYNNVIYAYDIKTRKPYDGLVVVPIDINSEQSTSDIRQIYDSLDNLMKAIQQNKYPSPPARELCFATKGKSKKKEVIEFLKWILKDGQKFVKDAGYLNLSKEKINPELNRF